MEKDNALKRIRLVVATHKPYRMPEDPVYLPLHTGAAGRADIGFRRDDDGENISGRNANWCELTGLYWAWRNLNADAVGLVHYRRHFRGAHGIATGGEIVAALSTHDIILPTKRNYFIETTYSQYVHAHHAEDLDLTRLILTERHPRFVRAFDEVMLSRKGHRFNMFVMKRPIFDRYCEWLFDVLFELERRLDTSGYSAYDARVFGFVAERLLDVWLAESGPYSIAEMGVVHLEGQRWPVKIARFLLRKFRARCRP
jgi:hypothetical protein